MPSVQGGASESLSMAAVTIDVESELRAKMEMEEIEVKHEDEMNECSDGGVKRVCHICGKTFATGKALGGHMRIHGHRDQKQKSLKPHQPIAFKKQGHKAKSGDRGGEDSSEVIEENTCMVCLKKFPSSKSLFGHMRCHPERGWRGMKPPSSMGNNGSSSSSYSSSLLDADPPPEIDDQIGASLSRKIDLSALLRGWTVTARRGRKAAMVDGGCWMLRKPAMLAEDDLRAVNGLMMLSQGRVSADSAEQFDESDAVGVHKVFETDVQVVVQSVNRVGEEWFEGPDDHNLSSDKDGLSGKNAAQLKKDEDFKNGDGVKEMAIKNINIKKKMKLSNLEMSAKTDSSPNQLVSYSSIHNSMDENGSPPNPTARGAASSYDNMSRRVPSFDLNEMPLWEE